jgi:hypothetical protein
MRRSEFRYCPHVILYLALLPLMPFDVVAAHRPRLSRASTGTCCGFRLSNGQRSRVQELELVRFDSCAHCTKPPRASHVNYNLKSAWSTLSDLESSCLHHGHCTMNHAGRECQMSTVVIAESGLDMWELTFYFLLCTQLCVLH